MAQYQRSLFIFRRDLRVDDNRGLIRALGASGAAIPLFICDPRQLKPHAYFSRNAAQFLAQSLADLSDELARRGGTLYFAEGEAESVLGKLIVQKSVQAVYLNRDYTPFSRKRDAAIESACRKAGIPFHSLGDALLHEPEAVIDAGKTPYKVFTPFMRFLRQMPVPFPAQNKCKNFFDGSIAGLSKEMPKALAGLIDPPSNPLLAALGGRKAALKILAGLGRLENYRQERDIPSLDGTSRLSAHLKFGTVSAREVYHAVQRQLGPAHQLINELYWRDFFHHVAFHQPKVFGRAFQEKYDGLRWSDDEKKFAAWKEGRTGFPIVDAGMRELNATGFMHNRVRMITGSFLTKDLHIDWRWGEKYFAQNLVDYDPCVNNGNWQWVASTGCDAQPYFRIFNPWSQQLRFDPDCLYIKKWIPELKGLSADEIHGLEKTSNRPASYPAPMVDHRAESVRAIAMFRQPGIKQPGPRRSPTTRPTESYGRRGGR